MRRKKKCLLAVSSKNSHFKYWLKLGFKILQQMSSPRNVCFNSFSGGLSRGHFFLHLGKKHLTGLVLFTHKKGWGVLFSTESQSSVIAFVCLFFGNSRSRKWQLQSQNCGCRDDIFLCWQCVKYNDGKQYVSQEGLGLALWIWYHTISFSS